MGNAVNYRNHNTLSFEMCQSDCGDLNGSYLYTPSWMEPQYFGIKSQDTQPFEKKPEEYKPRIPENEKECNENGGQVNNPEGKKARKAIKIIDNNKGPPQSKSYHYKPNIIIHNNFIPRRKIKLINRPKHNLLS